MKPVRLSYSSTRSNVRMTVAVPGVVGTGSPPVTLWGVDDGGVFVVSADAMVPGIVLRRTASPSRRVTDLNIGVSFSARGALRGD
jgi:hypothetical protein